MMEYAREHIAKSTVGGLLDSSWVIKSHPKHLNAGAAGSIDLMEKLIGKLSAAENAEYSAYLDAIMKLRHFYVIVSPRPESWARIVQWPLRLTPNFFELLRKRRAPALVILAHWIVPLHHAPKRWFLGDWPVRTIRAIVRHVPSSDWAQGLEWPLKEFALPILCDMAHSSNVCRKLLWQNKGLQFYISLLADKNWQVTALDAINVW